MHRDTSDTMLRISALKTLRKTLCRKRNTMGNCSQHNLFLIIRDEIETVCRVVAFDMLPLEKKQYERKTQYNTALCFRK